MYKFYNPHPQQKIVGDCVKRSLTKASGLTYQEVSNELNRIKREIGASSYASNSVWQAYVDKNLKGIKISFPAEKGKPRMNGERFCQEHPTGTYILNMAKHLACCVDGVIYDTWDSSEKCVYNAYRIPPQMMPMPGTESFPEFIESINEEKIAFDGIKLRGRDGESIITYLSELTLADIKVTKKQELWIPLTLHQYKRVFEALMYDKKFEGLVWDKKKGSKKYTIVDTKTGMTLILKSGSSSYVWCINNGK